MEKVVAETYRFIWPAIKPPPLYEDAILTFPTNHTVLLGMA